MARQTTYGGGYAREKEDLKKKGLWKKFYTRRDELKKQGTPPQEAEAQAYVEVTGEVQEHEMDKPLKRRPPATPFSELTKADFEGKRSGSFREAVEWVFNNLSVVDVTPEDAPSAGAWSLRELARSSPQDRREFIHSVASKLMPSRSQLDAEDMLADDGVETLCAQRLRTLRERAEGPDGEHQVPAEPVPADAA